MTQREQILTMLEEAGDRGVTGNTFYANFLPRFAARIHELKKQGHDIRRFPTEEPNVFLYRLVERGDCDTSASRASVPTLGQSPTTPGRGGDGQVLHVAGESSTSIGATSSSPQPRDAAPEPRQVTDADGSPGRDPSASLLLFDMPVDRYRDAA